MKRERQLRRRLQTLGMLNEAVGAMKSLAAHHFRAARAGLPAAREYRRQVDRVVADLHAPVELRREPAGLLLVASDLGLCGGYTGRLVQAALGHRASSPISRFYCVGRRALPALAREGVRVDREYRAPASAVGLTEMLLELARDLLEDHAAGRFRRLTVVSARFDGVGRFTPVRRRLLPPSDVAEDDGAPGSESELDAPGDARAVDVPPSPYASRERLEAVAIREYLYISLFETLLEAQAAEHGARILAAESAEEWLRKRIDGLGSRLAAIRQENATQEVLDVANAARRRFC